MVQYDIQRSIESVQDWLAQIFSHDQNIATLTPLAADASTRRYVRAQWGRPLNGQLASCVIMCSDPWPETKIPDFVAVAHHLRYHNVRVPHIYAVSPAEGLICMEDFGDRTLADVWRISSPEVRLSWGQNAIDAVIDMHVKATRHRDDGCPAFGLSFDVPKLLSELQFFRHHAIEGLWRHTLNDDEREAFDTAFMPLCAMLAEQPQYFCHRDYHGWNIMACCDSTVGILDFQDARMGPQPYDVVSLLVDRGTPEVLSRQTSVALVNYYLERFEATTGERMNREQFAVIFDLVAVHRCLKAIGTFAFMNVVNHRQHYQSYIAPTLAYLERLMRRYDILQGLMKLLYRYEIIS